MQRASEAFWGFSVRVWAWVWIWLWVWVEEGGCGGGGEGEGDGGGDSWERTSRISSSNYTIKGEMLAPLNECYFCRLKDQDREWDTEIVERRIAQWGIGDWTDPQGLSGRTILSINPSLATMTMSPFLTGTSNRIASFMGSSLLCVPTYIHIRGRIVMKHENEDEDEKRRRKNQLQVLFLFE